jgi:hypothetical protein
MSTSPAGPAYLSPAGPEPLLPRLGRRRPIPARPRPSPAGPRLPRLGLRSVSSSRPRCEPGPPPPAPSAPPPSRVSTSRPGRLSRLAFPRSVRPQATDGARLPGRDSSAKQPAGSLPGRHSLDASDAKRAPRLGLQHHQPNHPQVGSRRGPWRRDRSRRDRPWPGHQTEAPAQPSPAPSVHHLARSPSSRHIRSYVVLHHRIPVLGCP